MWASSRSRFRAVTQACSLYTRQAVKQACYVICSSECKDARCEHERRLQDEELVLENREQDAEQAAAFTALEGEEGEEGEEGDDDDGDDEADGNMEVDD